MAKNEGSIMQKLTIVKVPCEMILRNHNGLKVSYPSSPMIVCLKYMTIELLSREANLSCTSPETSEKHLNYQTKNGELTFW